MIVGFARYSTARNDVLRLRVLSAVDRQVGLPFRLPVHECMSVRSAWSTRVIESDELCLHARTLLSIAPFRSLELPFGALL